MLMLKSNLIFTAAVGGLLACCIGCGGSSYRTEFKDTLTTDETPKTTQSNPFYPNTPGGYGQNTATPITGKTGTALYEFDIDAVGYTSVSKTVETNSVLKVRFIPLENSKKVDNSGFQPKYSKLAVYLSVGTDKRPTPLLRNGLSGEAQKSPIYDFSSSFTKTCGTDTECRQEVTITVGQPNNDYWCYNYNMYCTHTHVYDTHAWSGLLLVETDDTEEITP